MTRDSELMPHPVLLGLLVERPRHGYELYQSLNRELARVWRIGLSQLYAHLKQLEKAGFVRVEIEPQANRPARKVYRLTEEGRTFFLDWLRRPTPYLRQIRVDLLLRVYFFHRLGLSGLDQLIDGQKLACQEQADRFERMARLTDDPFQRLVLDFRRGQLCAVISWLDRCAELKAWSAVDSLTPVAQEVMPDDESSL